MATVWVRRTLTGFVALDHEELPKTWAVGDTLRCEIVKPRNGKLHRKAFVLLKVVFPHTSYPSMEALRKAMTIGAGYTEEVINPMTGEVALSPRSWRFDRMDNEEFSALYQAMIGVALKLVSGSTRNDWETAVDELAKL